MTPMLLTAAAILAAVALTAYICRAIDRGDRCE